MLPRCKACHRPFRAVVAEASVLPPSLDNAQEGFPSHDDNNVEALSACLSPW